jgi:hypothetical protein
MSPLEILNLIAAIVVAAPLSIFIAQLLKRPKWHTGVKALLAFCVCIAVGVAQTWIAGTLLGLIGSWGELTSAQVIVWAGAVYVAATIEYHAYFAYLPWVVDLGTWPNASSD